ncbi:unnamed protein product [Cuscuta campestris]|uniref:Aconitase/3-isopropylmalate dehydratase large subunit alpha/beta/alpha domain-containing protein n=1 Tax=Cuscuta campestris TaxID=132261 RepID=A0A484LI15_9ASTE|nr:unnamed protein product [Cuscuta campestris]
MSNWKATLEFEVNIEYVGWIIFNIDGTLYLDSVVGKDSHTTMIDGLQVTGCGVGGIEAEQQEKIPPKCYINRQAMISQLLG